MAMNGIGQVDLYNDYQNRIQRTESTALKPEQEIPVQQQETRQDISLSLNLEGIRSGQNLSISDAKSSMDRASSSSFEMKALSYRPDPDDVDQAISDMQRDSTLMQYSYFVGDSNVILQNEDGLVLQKTPQE